MSSSTSSSSELAATGRRTFGKLLLVLTLGMALAMAIVRFFTFLNDASAETILNRVMEARAALPRVVAEEQSLVMAFGSSMTHAGFSARRFDRQLADAGVDVKSFNFGFGGLNPYFQDFLARRVRDAFVENDRRLTLTMIEFVPFQLTEARWQGAQEAVDSFVSMLATPRELFELALREPTRGIRTLNIHFLRNDISAEMVTWYFGQPFLTPPPRSDRPEDEANEELVDELGNQLNEKFEEEYPDYSGENWHYGWQGAGTIPEERSEETKEIFVRYYDAIRHPRRLENDRLRRIHCCDIEELHFEEELVAAFIRMVQVFEEFSDRVEIVLYPRNTAWIRYSPEAEARMAAVLERIARETGVPIRDYQVRDEIGPDMFSDTTHLSRYGGDVTFTALLAEEYGPLLAELTR